MYFCTIKESFKALSNAWFKTKEERREFKIFGSDYISKNVVIFVVSSVQHVPNEST